MDVFPASAPDGAYRPRTALDSCFFREDSMITQWPLVIFTVFSQLSAGLALFSWWKETRSRDNSRAGWKTAAVCAGIALVAGLVDAGGIARGPMLTAQTACLLLAICSAVAIRRSACAAAAMITGLVCVLSEAFAAVPGELLSASGLFPFALFLLCTVALGASFSQLTRMGDPEDPAVRYGRFAMPLRISLWLMLILTALTPCIVWEDPFMKRSAFFWMQTQLYWMGVIFSGVVIGLSHMGRVTLNVQAVVAFISIFGLRTAFYADSVHGAIDLSTLYMR